MENKLKSSFIPKILAESSENINSSLNHSEVTLSENQINADPNNSSVSSNESYEKTETSNSMLGWGAKSKNEKVPGPLGQGSGSYGSGPQELVDPRPFSFPLVHDQLSPGPRTPDSHGSNAFLDSQEGVTHLSLPQINIVTINLLIFNISNRTLVVRVKKETNPITLFPSF